MTLSSHYFTVEYQGLNGHFSLVPGHPLETTDVVPSMQEHYAFVKLRNSLRAFSRDAWFDGVSVIRRWDSKPPKEVMIDTFGMVITRPDGVCELVTKRLGEVSAGMARAIDEQLAIMIERPYTK